MAVSHVQKTPTDTQSHSATLERGQPQCTLVALPSQSDPLSTKQPRRAGDTIGVLLNRAAETISFFKDGVDLGVAFDHVQEERLYPCVGMRTKDEEVRQQRVFGKPQSFPVTEFRHVRG